eukprot:CAMPEP_0117428910 /NCGR_PEP_ID=MMETSP0758-20121206/8517_1 /TAXON_ID=63605 /ORGANISM="Percolomonas cosmopolitus, Strain AE-1 (ATCC 50343)" /LENGTH=632 /DNA_ID=CAMNT_0005215537 /DNA_START=343 /DNA_END=2238 /DNA_ORIENTATION=-
MEILYEQYAQTLKLLNKHSEHIVNILTKLQDEADELKVQSKKSDHLKDAYDSAEKMQLSEQKEYDKNKEKYKLVMAKVETTASSTKRPTKVPTSNHKMQSPSSKSPKNRLLKKEFSWQDTKKYADELYNDTMNEMTYQEKLFKIKYTKTMDELFTAVEEYCHNGKKSMAQTGTLNRDMFNEEIKAPTRKAVEQSKFKALHKKKVKSLDVSVTNSEDMQALLFGNANVNYAQKRRSYSQTRNMPNRRYKFARNNTHEKIDVSSTSFEDHQILFGKELVTVMARENEHGVVPQFYEQLLYVIEHHALQTVGIFRVPGAANTIQKLINRANSFQCLIQSEEFDFSINDVAGTIKKYLREMPTPLITPQFYDSALAIINPDSGLSKEEALRYLRTLLLRLPQSHLYVIQRTLVMMIRVARFSEINKMNLSNLAMVFGLNMVRPAKDNALIIASSTPYCNKFVLLMLNNIDVVLDVNDYFDHFGPIELNEEPLFSSNHVFGESSTLPEFFDMVDSLADIKEKPVTLQTPPLTPSTSFTSTTSTISAPDTSAPDTSAPDTSQPCSPSLEVDIDEKNPAPEIDIEQPTPKTQQQQDLSKILSSVPPTNRNRRSLSQTHSSNSNDFFTTLVRQNIARQEI